ncbi:MAG: histidinol-phosphate aminotransferase family protein [Desulfobacterales bacterium]|nr:histidinol-phosphate aminotransferase family protein [Desulfobacterales bacterium]
MIQGHGGNIYDAAKKIGCLPSEIIDMSSNVNPLGPPLGLIDYLKENINEIFKLPDVDSNTIIEELADFYNIPSSNILIGNGTTQFIYSLPNIINAKKAIIIGPTYADYKDACLMNNVDYEYFITSDLNDFEMNHDSMKDILHKADTVFICNPNNPTGKLISIENIEKLCKNNPDINFIIDESYLPFAEQSKSIMDSRLSNVIVLHSMSKIFCIPGLRIGYLIAHESIIERYSNVLIPWSVNSLAQTAITYVVRNLKETDDFIAKTKSSLKTNKQNFINALKNFDYFKIFPSETSFVLIKLLNNTADNICSMLLNDKILIRNCSNFIGLSNEYIRVSLKSDEINIKLAEKLIYYCA